MNELMNNEYYRVAHETITSGKSRLSGNGYIQQRWTNYDVQDRPCTFVRGTFL